MKTPIVYLIKNTKREKKKRSKKDKKKGDGLIKKFKTLLE